MALSPSRILELESALEELVGAELGQIIEAMNTQEDYSPFVQIPRAHDIDLAPSDLAELVIKSSNAYVRACRLHGMAKAELKLAERRYKDILKTSAVGKNDKEREANAIRAAREEGVALSVIESLVELASSAENSARIASESSRKLLDKISDMSFGSAREARGYSSREGF